MLLLHNILLILGTVFSIYILRRTNGNSILSWFILAICLQVGLVFTWLGDISINYYKEAGDSAFDNMGKSYNVFYVIALIFLSFELCKVRKGGVFRILEKEIIIRGYSLFFVLIASVFQMVFILTSPTSIEVLKNGYDTLGGSNYNSFRVTLLEVGNEDAVSGVLARIKNLSRSINLIGFLVLYYSSRNNKYRIKGLFGIMVFAGIIAFLDAFLLFEKAPVLILLIGVTGIKYSGFFARISRRDLARWSAFLFIFVNFLVVIVISKVQGLGTESAIEFLYYRIFLVPSITSLMHFDVYPDMLPHVEFSNSGLVQSIFDVKNKTIYGGIGLDVAMKKTGLYYSANANAVASAWAQGGAYMVGFISFIACSLFFLIDRYIWRRRALILSYPLVIYYLFWFIPFGNTAFENVILTSSLWFIPVVYPFFFKKRFLKQ